MILNNSSVNVYCKVKSKCTLDSLIRANFGSGLETKSEKTCSVALYLLVMSHDFILKDVQLKLRLSLGTGTQGY